MSKEQISNIVRIITTVEDDQVDCDTLTSEVLYQYVVSDLAGENIDGRVSELADLLRYCPDAAEEVADLRLFLKIAQAEQPKLDNIPSFDLSFLNANEPIAISKVAKGDAAKLLDQATVLVTDWMQQFIQGLLSPRPLFAASTGERALVINDAREIAIRIVDSIDGSTLSGFKLQKDGHITFGLRLPEQSVLPELPFTIDVMFIPTGEIVCQQEVEGPDRSLLLSALGLKFDFELPGLKAGLGDWQDKLKKAEQEHILLPKAVFALRFWWH